MILKTKPGPLTRKHIAVLDDAATTAPSWVCEAIDYADGNNRPYIEQAMADRFATELKKVKSDVTGAEETYRVYSKAAAAAAIRQGLFEVVSVYTMPRIMRELATIWAYGYDMDYSGVSDPEAFEDDMAALRADGRHDLIMQRVDYLSVGVGSSLCLVQVLGSRINYQPIERDKVWIAFADAITDNGKERPVDRFNIDEASAVVIQTAPADESGNLTFVAYYGRSDKYENGRQVKYKAKMWSDVPAVGAPEAADYIAANGDIANPLTAWQSKDKAHAGSIPEYPVVIWAGLASNTMSEILPTSDGLFRQCKEIDLAASRILLSTLKSARGVYEFNREAGASNVVPQTIDEGVVGTEHGQKIQVHNVPGINSNYAMSILNEMVAHTAASYGVPSWKMSVSSTAMVPSGAALRELNRPLNAARQARIEANRSNVARKFAIETALCSIENGSAVAPGAVESWEPEEEPIISDRMADLQAAQLELQMGIASVDDIAASIYPELDTEEKLMNYMDSVRAKAPQPAPAPASGVARLMGPRAVAQ